MKSSKTSGQVLISKDTDLKKFWNTQTKNLSEKLWLPTKTDLLESHSNLSNTLSPSTVEKSWFSINNKFQKKKNLWKICFPSSMYSVQDIMGQGNIKTKKIKIYPKIIAIEKKKKVKVIDQKLIIKKWFNVARYCYNKSVEFLADKKKSEGKTSFYSVRKELNATLPDFIKEVPYEIRDGAYKDACIAVKTAKKLYKKDKKFRKIKFKSRKDVHNSILIPKSSIGNNCIYKRYLDKMLTSKTFSKPDCNSRLYYNKKDGFYLCLSVKYNNKKTNKQKQYIALDPGVRTFLTGYYGDGIIELGKNDICRIYRLTLFIDKLKSEQTQVNAKKRYRIGKAINRVRRKIKNLIKESHNKMANFLCKNFKNIIIPEFGTKQISRTSIAKSVKRKLFSWSHYSFRQHLIHKAMEYGVNIRLVNESYTSKTCTSCGKINSKLGGKKTFKCPHCKMEIDRDVNGARNILLRALRDSASPSNS